MNIVKTLRIDQWIEIGVFILLLAFASISCACHGTSQAKVAVHGIDSFQLQKSIQSDELWTDRLIFDASEGIKSGKTGEVLKQLQSISNSIIVLQLSDDGVDCVEPILLDRDKIMQKLIKFSNQLGVDINLIRFVSIEEKAGFVQAMAVIVDKYMERQLKVKALDKSDGTPPF